MSFKWHFYFKSGEHSPNVIVLGSDNLRVVDIEMLHPNFCSPGLPDDLFSNQTNLGKFWRALDSKLMIYFMVIWIILGTLVIF
jgi:hypothetical protein